MPDMKADSDFAVLFLYIPSLSYLVPSVLYCISGVTLCKRGTRSMHVWPQLLLNLYISLGLPPVFVAFVFFILPNEPFASQCSSESAIRLSLFC